MIIFNILIIYICVELEEEQEDAAEDNDRRAEDACG